MTPSQLRDILRGARAAIEAVEEALEATDECDHPEDLLEDGHTPMGSPRRRFICRGCGSVIEKEWEDGEN